MFFQYSTAASFLALCSLPNALAFNHKRDTTTTSLYAYGSEADGAPVFYSNGLAYIGLQAPTWSGTSTNITFNTDSSNTTAPWTIDANSTTVSFNKTLELYIVPTTSSYTQVGFVSTTGTAPTGAVTTGFAFFGTQVAYAASESNYELLFWATSTNETGIYGLYWNAAGSPTNGSFPVVIKTTPPTVV